MNNESKIRLMSRKDYLSNYGAPEWTCVSNADNGYVFIDESNEVVGDCLLNEFYEDFTVIDHIVMRYLGRGYGTNCVNLLKEKYPNLSGESSSEAVGFWFKMGAKFDDQKINYTYESENYGYLEYDGLCSFKL